MPSDPSYLRLSKFRFQAVTTEGLVPAVIGIDLRNNNDSTSSLSTFITESEVIRDVTLRDSGPCH